MTVEARRIAYATGTRADFGLLASTLQAMARDPRFSLGMLVTGMHLSAQHGMTVAEIEAAGLRIAARIPVRLDVATGATMARNIGAMTFGFVDALERERPQLLLVLGDRGEMLAATIAAVHLGIAVAHLHGGERSGTVDEPVRHAISKLAHLHLVATEAARDRLVRMGEHGACVHVVGAPGIDGLASLASIDRTSLCAAAGFDPARPIALLVFHPVLHEAAEAGHQVKHILEAASAHGLQTLALMPNSDAGSDIVRQALEQTRRPGLLVLRDHLPRPEFVSWMAHCDVMLGNSSSGIIEAATFGTPVVNVGSRQNMRERNSNVIDTEALPDGIRAAVAAALARGRGVASNIYGDGAATPRIIDWLASVPLTPELLAKCNAY